MTREDKRAYNYARNRLANDDYPVYNDEYELELAYKAGTSAAIQEACEWLDENMNDVGIRFMRGDEIKDIVDLFCKAMRGDEE